MPLYVYEAKDPDKGCEKCRGGFEIPQSLSEPIIIAPTFVGFTTSIRTVMRFLSLQNSSTVISGLLLSVIQRPRTRV